jgi:long-subunit acyl-CoA synthetase (AMP-forming)
MAETCAGAIYNLDCPSNDIDRGWKIVSLGRYISGIEIHLTVSETGQTAEPGVSGSLIIRGDVVFEGYYRNPAATAEAFTADG